MSREATEPANEMLPAVLVAGAFVSVVALLDLGRVTDNTLRQFLYDLSVAGGHLVVARQYLAEKLGVTSPQYNIVMIIAKSGGHHGITVSNVAAKLNVTSAFVTNEVKKLAKVQFIVKRTNPEDGRSVLLNITATGAERIRALGPHLTMVNDRLFSRLTREEFKDLAGTVSSLVNTFAQSLASLKAVSTFTGDEEMRAVLATRRQENNRAVTAE